MPKRKEKPLEAKQEQNLLKKNLIIVIVIASIIVIPLIIYILCGGYATIIAAPDLQIITIKEATKLPYNNTRFNFDFANNVPFNGTIRQNDTKITPINEAFKHNDTKIESIIIPADWNWPTERNRIILERQKKYINFDDVHSNKEAIDRILEKMDFKINFNSFPSDVHDLEVYYGIKVPHNYSGIKSYHHADNAGHRFYILRFSSGFMDENFLFLPPAGLDKPHGLVPQLEYLFWKNNEHIISFKDTREWHVSVSWDIRNGKARTSCSDTCKKSNSSHHLNYCNWPERVSKPEIDGTVIVNAGHYINMYQHFFDNAQPHNAISLITTGLKPNNVTIYTEASGSLVHQMQDQMGFIGQINGKNQKTVVSAKRLILAAVVRVVHPWYFDWFTDLMDIPNLQRNKIIIMPRGGVYGGKGERIISNLVDLKGPLSEIYGSENVIIFNKDDYRQLSQLRELFASAKIIIGPHGGAFYNAFLGGKDIIAVELLPIQTDGSYPRSTFGNMCIYSNTQMLGQKLYRYYTIANNINYNIDINDFMEWFKNFPMMNIG